MSRAPLPVRLHRVVVDDWERMRAIRLAMLADTPIAYGERLADARRLRESAWRERAAQAGSARRIALAAVAPAGAWVGFGGGYLDAVGGPTLVSVYIAPEARGRGVLDALAAAVGEWALLHADRLRLEVHEDNARAIRAYERLGFRRTGHTRPYDLDPAAREVEMVLTLA